MSKKSVVIPVGLKPYPESYEITAADIIAKHFDENAIFIKRSRHKTPDLSIKNLSWEIKSPTGTGKHNIQHCLQDASSQSQNIILDTRRSKIHQNRIKIEATRQFKLIRRAKRLLIITKDGKIIEFNK